MTCYFILLYVVFITSHKNPRPTITYTPFRPSTASCPRTWNNSLSDWQARSQRTFVLSAKGYGKRCEQRSLFSKLYLPVDILAIEFIRKSLALPNTVRRSALALENNTHLFNAFFSKDFGSWKRQSLPLAFLAVTTDFIHSIQHISPLAISFKVIKVLFQWLSHSLGNPSQL